MRACRIFSGACRPLASGVADKLGYHDFIWLLLSEEDKTSDTAIAYWFRAIDLDADGYITPYEMEFFYKEQLHRMDCLAQEVVQFEDILCQMTDMVKPEREGYITVLDLKRCKQAGVFFNVLFNLTKFIQYDQKDPTQVSIFGLWHRLCGGLEGVGGHRASSIVRLCGELLLAWPCLLF